MAALTLECLRSVTGLPVPSTTVTPYWGDQTCVNSTEVHHVAGKEFAGMFSRCFGLDNTYSGNCLGLNLKEIVVITKPLNLLVMFYLANKGGVDSRRDIRLHW